MSDILVLIEECKEINNTLLDTKHNGYINKRSEAYLDLCYQALDINNEILELGNKISMRLLELDCKSNEIYIQLEKEIKDNDK